MYVKQQLKTMNRNKRKFCFTKKEVENAILFFNWLYYSVSNFNNINGRDLIRVKKYFNYFDLSMNFGVNLHKPAH